jgi:hypothetical protein
MNSTVDRMCVDSANSAARWKARNLSYRRGYEWEQA